MKYGIQDRLIIDDQNYQLYMPQEDGHVDKEAGGGEKRLCGHIPRDWGKVAYGNSGFAIEPTIPIIPLIDWPELIKEKKAKKQTNKDLWATSAIGVLDQDGLNYCHAYSAVMGLMMARLRMGLPFVRLSAGSIGGPITNYQNEGAWIGDDLKQMRDVGAASTEFVPMDQVSHRGWLPGAAENCSLHRVEEVWEHKSRDFLQEGSTLLSGFTVSVGLNYWGHAVEDFDVVDLHPDAKTIDIDRFGVEFLNSWNSTWGDGGFAIRAGSKKYADEAYTIRTVILSEK